MKNIYDEIIGAIIIEADRLINRWPVQANHKWDKHNKISFRWIGLTISPSEQDFDYDTWTSHIRLYVSNTKCEFLVNANRDNEVKLLLTNSPTLNLADPNFFRKAGLEFMRLYRLLTKDFDMSNVNMNERH